MCSCTDISGILFLSGRSGELKIYVLAAFIIEQRVSNYVEIGVHKLKNSPNRDYKCFSWSCCEPFLRRKLYLSGLVKGISQGGIKP